MRINTLESSSFTNFQGFHIQKGAKINKRAWMKSNLVQELSKNFEIVADSVVIKDTTKKRYTENDVINSAVKAGCKLTGTCLSILASGFIFLPSSFNWAAIAAAGISALFIFLNEFKNRPIQGEYPNKVVEFINFGNSIYKDPEGYIELIGKNELPTKDNKYMHLTGNWTLDKIKEYEKNTSKTLSKKEKFLSFLYNLKKLNRIGIKNTKN